MLAEIVKENIALQAAICLVLSIVGMGLIYVGFAFLNKRLFPENLDILYTHTGGFSRMMVFLFASAWPANYLLSKTFVISSASIAGPSIIIATVLVIVANALIMDGVKLTVPVIGATTLAVLSCGLVSWLLAKQL